MEHVLRTAVEVDDDRRHRMRGTCMACVDDCERDLARDTRFAAGLLQNSRMRSLAASEHRELRLMFYSPPANDDVRNRLVAWATALPQYTVDGERVLQHIAHVELAFPTLPDGSAWAPGRTAGFSIVQKGTVFFREKRWREGYLGVSIWVPAAVYTALFARCIELSEQNIKFDVVGMYSSHFAPRAVL